MEANLLAAEPSALALRERTQGYDEQQPEAEASENGRRADVEGTARSGFPMGAAIIAVLAVGVAQILWVAMLAYGAYTAVDWLS